MARHLAQPEDYKTDKFRFGFVITYDGSQETTIAFDGTNTFTLAPTGTYWHYYRNDIKYTVSGAKTVTLSATPPAAKGHYFIYIDSVDGSLTCDTVGWTLEDTKVPVATIAWDNALTPKYWMSNERHSASIDRRFHWEHHWTDGTEIYINTVVSGQSVAPAVPVDTNNTFALSAAVIIDEDIKHLLDALADGDGTTAQYSVFYRASAGVWNWEASAVPFRYTAAGYIQYDLAGTMTQGQGNKFYTTYLLLTNHGGAARFATVHGQAEYGTLAAAQAETFGGLTKTGICIDEFVAVYQFVWETSAAYSTKGKCRLAATPRSINVSASGAVIAGTLDHESLSGLQGGGTGEHYHLTSADNNEAVAFLNGGTSTHTAMDAHITSTANPHSVTAAQAGAVPNDGWVALSITGTSRSQAFTNDPASGASIILNMTSTTGFVAEDFVTVSSSAGSEMAQIASVVANTSITLKYLTLNHTTTSRLVTAFYITASSDISATISKGYKIKYTQSAAVKYAVVKAVSGTTITFVANTDYPLLDAANGLTSFSYSTAEIPLAWPDWFNFTPYTTGSGSMTWVTTSIAACAYKIQGLTALMSYTIVGTTGGTASNSLIIYIPVANASTGLVGSGYQDGAGVTNLGWSQPITNNIYNRKADSSNFGLGVDRVVTVMIAFRWS